MTILMAIIIKIIKMGNLGIFFRMGELKGESKMLTVTFKKIKKIIRHLTKWIKWMKI